MKYLLFISLFLVCLSAFSWSQSGCPVALMQKDEKIKLGFQNADNQYTQAVRPLLSSLMKKVNKEIKAGLSMAGSSSWKLKSSKLVSLWSPQTVEYFGRFHSSLPDRHSQTGHSLALRTIGLNFNGSYWPSRPLGKTIGAAGGQHTRACTGLVRLIGDYAGLIFLCFVSFHLRKRNEGAVRRLRAWNNVL